jgi:hypothetical protein
MPAVRRLAAAKLLAVVVASASVSAAMLLTSPAAAAPPTALERPAAAPSTPGGSPSASRSASGPASSRKPAAVASGPVNFYVVQPAYQGQPEFLFEIALRFLGSGDRNAEIFALNKGRLQPDGLRMTRAEELLPGWVLQLPSDASGAEVQTGPLPTGAPAGRPSAVPSTAAGAPPRSAQPASTSPASAASADGSTGASWWILGLLAVGGALLVACIVVAIGLWRRGELPPFPDRATADDRTPAQVWANQDRLVFAASPQEPETPSRRPALVLGGVTALALAAVGTAVGLLTVPDPDPAPTAPAAAADPRFGPRITSRDATLCLAATTASDGSPLILATCNGAPTQQWQVASDGTIRTADRCMDVAAASTVDGAVVEVASCNGNRAQQFTFEADRLVSKLTGNCVDVLDSRVERGAAAIIRACAKVGDRTWQQLP